MPAARGGRVSSRSFGAVRVILIALSLAAIAVVAGLLFFRYLKPGFSGDASSLLVSADSALSDPSRTEAAASLLDKAAAAVAAKGGGVESELAVLKRRRTLARLQPAIYGIPYMKAAVAAAERLPNAEELAAVVVDAALAAGVKKPEILETLRKYASRLGVDRFGALKTAAYIRMDALAAPSSSIPASALLAAADVYAAKTPDIAADLAVDAAISALLSGDTLTARTVVRDRLSRPDDLSPAIVRFLAEFFYDFGDARESAALFSRLAGEDNTLRRADASYLAGDADSARSSWQSASSGKKASVALYNLASSAKNVDETRAYLNRLRASAPDFAPAIILYSRLAGEKERQAALSAAASSKDVRVELEAARIDAPRVGIARTEARLWLITNRDPKSETAARWAAWYMASNGAVDEANRAALSYRQASGDASWVYFYTALAAARGGRVDEAEKAFEKAASVGGDWRLAANLAVLSEARQNPAEALKRYEIAVSLHPSRVESAELLLRTARIMKELGRETEARRSLEYALSLDPENRRVRSELRKSTSP